MTMAIPMLLTRAIWIAVCFVSLSTARLLTQAGNEVKRKTGESSPERSFYFNRGRPLGGDTDVLMLYQSGQQR